MDNKLALMLAGVGFALLGYGIGYERARRQITKVHADRADSEIAAMRERYYGKDDETPEEEVEEDVNAVEEKEGRGAELAIFDKTEDTERTNYSGFADKEENAEVAFEEHDPDEYDAFDELVGPPSPEYEGLTGPHTISTDEFLANEFDFEQTSWTYFRSDGLVVDFWNQIIDDYRDFLGDATDKLANAHDDFVLFVRSPEYEMEIELILDARPFEESVAGSREKAQQEIAKRRKNDAAGRR